MKAKAAISILVFVAIWSLISLFELVNPVALPSPWEVALAFAHLSTDKEFYLHITATLLRALAAFSAASVIGIALGISLGYFVRIAGYFSFFIDFFRSLPAVALIPLFLVFFGVGNRTRILLTIYAVVFIMLINTMYGVKTVKSTRRDMFKVYNAGKKQTLTKLIIPEAMPHIISGLRVGLSFSIILVIVMEMLIGTTYGLGYIIQTEQLLYHIPEMYVYIIVTGIMGYSLNKIIILLERRYIFWASK